MARNRKRSWWGGGFKDRLASSQNGCGVLASSSPVPSENVSKNPHVLIPKQRNGYRRRSAASAGVSEPTLTNGANDVFFLAAINSGAAAAAKTDVCL